MAVAAAASDVAAGSIAASAAFAVAAVAVPTLTLQPVKLCAAHRVGFVVGGGC